ncbi:MAG: hypothetical protein JXQ91_15645 [Vannielia sp.]|uniref:lipase family protein n=1 Tax=Vannielia sp. TaxID=2813045 RepID=UPI003B8B84E2
MTIVRSDLTTRPCLFKAGAINYHVYNRSVGSVHPDLRPWYNAVPETWDPPEVEQDRTSGFYSEFYRPKGPPGSPGYCPPVLAFRGSETNPADFAKLGIVVRIELGVDSSKSFSGLENLIDLLTWKFSPFEFAICQGAGRDATREQTVAFARGLSGSRPIADLPGVAHVRIKRPNFISPLLLPEVEETLTVTYRISATVHFEDEGDWGTNITQGMGEDAEQYQRAAQEGKRRAAEVLEHWDGKMIVTGHSLGGGLAAAAAISGKFHHELCQIDCVTYNAAGVHENSVRNYVSYEASLGENPSTSNFSVEHEVLNTLQLQPNKLPLVQTFIGWANAIASPEQQMAFREARNTTAITRGISPGSTSMGYWAPDYENLPILWPLSQNTVADAQARLAADQNTQDFLAQQAASRETLLNDAREEIFGPSGPLFDEEQALWEEHGQLGAIGDDTRMQEIQDRLREIETTREEMWQQAQNAYEVREPTFSGQNTGKFPQFTALDAMARNCSTPRQFVAGLIGYLLDGDMNPHRPSTYDLTDGALGPANARAQQLAAEAEAIVPIGIASVAYHTFDPCAFTFHHPRR